MQGEFYKCAKMPIQKEERRQNQILLSGTQ